MERDEDYSVWNGPSEIEYLFSYSFFDKEAFFSDVFKIAFNVSNIIINPTMESFMELIVPENRKYFEGKFFLHINSKKQNFDITFNLLDRNGNEEMLYMKSIILYDCEGRPSNIKGTLLRISDMDSCVTRVKEYAYADSLTRLPNRKAYDRDMGEILCNADSTGFIILVDLDNVGQINIMHSYAVGEKVIWYVGCKLPILIEGSESKVYYLAGGQYIIVLQNSTLETTISTMIRIKEYLKKHVFDEDNKAFSLTVSSGAVAYLGKMDSPDKLLLNAKIVVDKVKSKGKDGYDVYSISDGKLYIQQLELINRLKQDILSDFRGFQLYYQPIFSTQDAQCIGAEALLRWQSPEQEIVSPDLLIPVFEKIGLMQVVEKWILNTACGSLKKWLDTMRLPTGFFVQINLSPKQITRTSLYQEVMSAISENGISALNIVLEVTETYMMIEKDNGIHLLNELRKEGIRIAVDDFGTGYSSLSYLKTLPVDEIKIDKSFVRNIENDTSSRSFLVGILGIIRSMGYIICVEGVETEEQKEILTMLQVDMLQGFLFDKPIQALEFEEKYIRKPQG